MVSRGIPRWRLLLGWPLHVLSAGLLLGLIVAIQTTFPESSSAVILHYSVGVGIDFIGESNQINTLMHIGAILLIVNILLGHLIYSTSRAATWLLWGINPISQTLLLLAYLLLWQLNQ